MKVAHYLTALNLASLCVVVGYLGCTAIPELTAIPEVKPTCVISWDRSADLSIDEYRVTVWMVSEGNKVTQYRVKAPATQVSCQEVGANTTGKWKVTIQACPKVGICSDSSKPISFKVVNR